jgi:excisionase family DNA binding protein
MFEVELKFKINGRGASFDRLIETFKIEIVQAIEGATKSRSTEIGPAKSAPQIEPGPGAYSMAETAALLSLSKAPITRRIREGTIRAVRVGNRVLVPSQSIRELLRYGI